MLLLGTALLLPHAASATDWYVDGLKGGAAAKGTAAQPFLYAWQGAKAALPGDTVHLLPTVIYPPLTIQVSGTAGRPITYVGAGVAPNMTRVAGDGAHFGIWLNADYVTISNLDVTAPGVYAAIFIANNHQHVTITGNVAHDAGGSGIQSVSNDYLTISNNVVYGNAHVTTNAFNSGISTLWNQDMDSNTGVKVVITGNIVFGNTNLPPCAPCKPATATNSDGNGIIVDDSRHTQTTNVAYRGRTLISNNVIFGNGGRGVHIFNSDHVTVTGNTAYSNNQDPYESSWRPGEIMAAFSGDVTIADNIVNSSNYSRTATGLPVPISVTNCSGAAVVAAYNLGFDPQNDQVMSFTRSNSNQVTIAANLWGDPLFVKPSLDPTVANFAVQTRSPALSVANMAMSTLTDILNVSRAPLPSLGAYQIAAPNVVSAAAGR